MTETMAWDALGRLARRDTDYSPPAQDVERQYLYDGSGRLQRAERSDAGGTWETKLWYDADDALVYEERSGPGGAGWVMRYGGYRAAEGPGGLQVMETVLPMVRLEDGELRVVYTEPDGHAVWTRGRVASITDTTELLGVYGQELLAFALPAVPVLDGYHGAEMDRFQEVVHFGARHMALSDGAWMQPEPLLYLGLTNGDLAHPLGYLGRYAGGNPVRQADRSGDWIESAWDAGNIGMGAYSAYQNVVAGNYGSAVVDGLGVIADVLATAVPVVPGGAGAVIKAARAGDKVVDLAKSGDRVVDAADTAADVGKAAQPGVVSGALAGAAAWVQGDGATAGPSVTAADGQQGNVTDVPGSTPGFRGAPGSVARGETQSRLYGEDGFPQTDRELGHPDEKGVGSGEHAHDWGRPDGGGASSHLDRGPPRAPAEGDPPSPRGPGVPPP